MGACASRITFRVAAWVLALTFGAPAGAGTILVTDAGTGTSPACTLRQAIWLANITTNGGPWPYGQTPAGATTIHPLTSNYIDFEGYGLGSCVIVPDANPGTVIDLAAIAGQTLTYSIDWQMDGNWYGPTALPAIASDITIEGHGVALIGLRGDPISGRSARLFFVGADPTRPETPGYNTPGPGKLTLRNLTLSGGGQVGGRAGIGGGGGGAMGGAIFNQGTLNLIGVTLRDNWATGGGTYQLANNDTGGGMSTGGDDHYVGMGGYVPLGTGDVGAPVSTDFNVVNGRAGGGIANGLGGRGGSNTGCCGFPGGSGGAAGNGSGGGGGGGGAQTQIILGQPQIFQLPGGGGSGAGLLGGTGARPGYSGDFGLNGVADLGSLSYGRVGAGDGGGVGGGGSGFANSSGPTFGGGGGGGFGGGGGAGGMGGQYPNGSIERGIHSMGGDGGFGGGAGGSSNPIPDQTARGGYGGGDAFGAYSGGGAGMGGAIFNQGGIVNIVNSTLEDNFVYGGAAQAGGAGSAMGSAIFNLNGQVTLSYTTIAYNGVGIVGLIGVNCCDLWGDTIYSVAYNGAASTGSTLARVVINNSILVTHPLEGSDNTSFAIDQPALVAGGLTNVATHAAVSASGINVVSSAQARGNASAFPNVAYSFFPNFILSGATGPEVLMPQDGELLGSTDCRDANGQLVTTDQRGLPRPATGCDVGAAQRQRPRVATSAGSALFVQSGFGASAAIVIDGNLGVSDIEPSITTLATASITIATNYHADQDQLSFTANAASTGNIVATAFDSANGRLMLSSQGSLATFAQWQAALRAVKYTNTLPPSTAPDVAPRGIAFAISDGVVGSDSATRAVQVYSAIRLSTTLLPDGVVGSGYTGAVSADGGTGSYSFSLLGGALPQGMTLSPSGALSGTPVAAGNAAFAVQAIDTVGSNASRTYHLNVNPRSSTTALVASSPTSVQGEAVTLTASVAGTSPSGSVTITDGAATLCSALTLVDGSASCTVSTLTVGAHTLGASYGGDGNHLASVATPVSHAVLSTTITALSTQCTLTFVENTLFTLAATVSGAIPTGTVTFYVDGLTPYCSNTALLQQSAACTLPLTSVNGHAQDTYQLTVVYSGDTANATSTSAPLAVRVLSASDVLFRDGFQVAAPGCEAPSR